MSPRPAAGPLAGAQDRTAGRAADAPCVRVAVALPADHAAAPAEIMPHGMAIVARASWPEMPGDTLTPIPAFVVSSFSPLVAEVADRCLRAYYTAPPAGPGRGAGTAIVLASRHGDAGTGAAVALALAEHRRVPPLLFFQSNVNAVAGYVAARWGLAGPVVCTCPAGDLLDDGLACAALLFADGDASEALVIAVEHGSDGEDDSAAAVLVTAQPRQPETAP
jgi:Beta-ketoacyl synthase, N-terminal domain